MEEENYSTFFGEMMSYVSERHSLTGWIFLFIFFILCRLLIGKNKNIGNIFLLAYGDDDEESIVESVFKGSLTIYFGSIFLTCLIFLILLLVKWISSLSGYVMPHLNLNLFLMDCVLIWAIIACGYVRFKERKAYISEISYLRKELINSQTTRPTPSLS